MLPEIDNHLRREPFHPRTHLWNLDEAWQLSQLPVLFNMAQSIAESYDLSYLPLNMVPPNDRAMLPYLEENCPNAMYVRNPDLPNGLHFAPQTVGTVYAELPVILRIPSFKEFGPVAVPENNLYYASLYPAHLEMEALLYNPNSDFTVERYALEGKEAAIYFRFYEILKQWNLGWSEMWERTVDPGDPSVQEEMAEIMEMDINSFKRYVLAGKVFILPNLRTLTFAPDGEAIYS